jgi:eukaryotic-like serine/threonine-protein kinase
MDSDLHELKNALGLDVEFGDLIGQGQFARVYRATDLALGRQIAVKVFRKEIVEQVEGMRERFVRSARTPAHLEHPNILRVYDVRATGALVWMTMPYIAEGSLATLLEREGRLDPARGVRVLARAAEAIRHVHAKGIIFRDLKPRHLLLDGPELDVRLIDFVLARVAGPSYGAGYVVGTPEYMSPEQAAGSAELGSQTDIYALGVVGYELLTGRLPFVGTAEALAIARLTEPPRDPVEFEPNIPPAVSAALLKCLAKDPAARGSAAEVLAVLATAA